jgi:hypothetical protein
MQRLLQTVFVTSVALLVGIAMADDDKDAKQAKKKAKKGGENPAVAKVFAVPEGITLSEEQQAKLTEIKKEFGPKVEDAFKKRDAILSEEQIKARADANKAARTAGKKGKEAQADVDAAMKLTDEQKKKMADSQKEIRDLQTKVRDKLTALLNDEQKAKLPKKAGDKKKKSNENK